MWQADVNSDFIQVFVSLVYKEEQLPLTFRSAVTQCYLMSLTWHTAGRARTCDSKVSIVYGRFILPMPWWFRRVRQGILFRFNKARDITLFVNLFISRKLPAIISVSQNLPSSSAVSDRVETSAANDVSEVDISPRLKGYNTLWSWFRCDDVALWSESDEAVRASTEIPGFITRRKRKQKSK